MDKDLINGKLGTVGDYNIAFTDGMVSITTKVTVPEAALALTLQVHPKAILDAMAAKIGGPIPTEVAAFLDTALGLK